jgi:hypothetical protein
MGDRSPLSKTYRAFGEAIDAAALDASAWQGVACFMGAAFPGTHTTINIDDFTGGGASCSVSNGYDEDVIKQYITYYSHINPWLPYFSSVPCLHSFTMDETGGVAAFRKTEFCDWFLRLGELNHATGIKLLHDRNQAAMLAVHYGDTVTDRYNAELPRLLSESAIRLKRALDLNRIAEGKAIAARVADFVAQLPNPAFVLDGRCRIVEMNSAAEAELTSGKHLRVTSSRPLCQGRRERVPPDASGGRDRRNGGCLEQWLRRRRSRRQQDYACAFPVLAEIA